MKTQPSSFPRTRESSRSSPSSFPRTRESSNSIGEQFFDQAAFLMRLGFGLVKSALTVRMNGWRLSLSLVGFNPGTEEYLMANSDRVGVWPCVSAFRPNLKHLCVLLAGVFCAASAAVQAAQVTFAFDATVTDIADPGGVAAALPFQPTIGQSISGLVTFTPVPFGLSSGPNGRLAIDMAGERFAAPNLPVVSLNDVFSQAGSTLRGPDDSIAVTCSELTACMNAESSVAGVTLVYAGIGVFSRNSDIIAGGTDIASVAVWNALPNRRLVFQLSALSGGLPITIGTGVDPMTEVPEPSTLRYAVLPVVPLFLAFGTSRRRPRQNRMLLALLVVAVSAAQSTAQAAQVTFAFDATVTEVFDLGLLPFQPMLGQSMSGKVTFTPVPFGQTSDIDAKLEVAWEGETFTASSHELMTLNDHGVTLGAPFDALAVQCGVPGGCATSSTGVSIFEFALVLRSFHDVLPAGQLMNSAVSWNQFDDRRIVLSISDLNDMRRMGIIASVGPMRAVPEPSSVLMLVSLGSFLMVVRRPHF